MSSTNRAAIRSEKDFYPTPAWCVERLLDSTRVLEYCESSWLEPCAGNGAIIEAVNKFAADDWLMTAPQWDAVEIREEARTDLERLNLRDLQIADFLDGDTTARLKYDVIITNPPFSHWEEFLEKSLSLTSNVIFLLRLDVLGSDKRSKLWNRHNPAIKIMSKRPSFTPDGKTDSIYYAWFCWGIGTPGTWQVI